MKLLTKELIQELLSVNQAPCFSLYMPTHRTHPEKLQDKILFDNLVKKMEGSLANKYSVAEVQKHLEPIRALANDNSIWAYTLDGLAVFSAKGIFKVVGLHKSMEPLAIVADSFHTKPLWRYLQSADNYHVLCLTLHDIRLFEGDRHSLTEVELTADIPKTIVEALGEKLTEKHLSVTSHGGVGGESSPLYHGHGSKNEETEKDTDRFFRMVADLIYQHYSKPLGWPLLLAALPEHHRLFQTLNKNPFLLAEGIELNPASLSVDKLTDMAWEILEPRYKLKLNSLVARYEQTKADAKASDDFKDIAVAAVEGRVDILLVEADRIIPIRITNLVTGNTQHKDLNNPKVDDLLDDLGELVLRMGGQVMVLPTDMMPSTNGLAAIFRY